MKNPGLSAFGHIFVVFERRPDGGLRVYSDDVPGFMLSHPDADAVMRDVEPALKTIISEIVGTPVRVKLVGSIDNEGCLDTRSYHKLIADMALLAPNDWHFPD